jgi:multimeric flavodoxin WrbA
MCDYKILPCIECNNCYADGICPIDDDYQKVLDKALGAQRLIFATPVFFMTVCAQAKTFIDRNQNIWAYRNILKRPLVRTGGGDLRAMVIAVGGSRSRKMFDCVRLTMKTWLDVLDAHYAANLFVSKVNDAGEIRKNQKAMDEAYRLGRELITTETLPEKPVDVELVI